MATKKKTQEPASNKVASQRPTKKNEKKSAEKKAKAAKEKAAKEKAAKKKEAKKKAAKEKAAKEKEAKAKAAKKEAAPKNSAQEVAPSEKANQKLAEVTTQSDQKTKNTKIPQANNRLPAANKAANAAPQTTQAAQTRVDPTATKMSSTKTTSRKTETAGRVVQHPAHSAGSMLVVQPPKNADAAVAGGAVVIEDDVTTAEQFAVTEDVAVAEQVRPAAETKPVLQGTAPRQTTAPPPPVFRAAATDNKPVIFLAFANDRDDTIGYLRNLPDEARRLRDVLQPAEQAGLCEVLVRSNSTAADIFKVFQDPRYRNRIAILHYGGHANGYELLLESAAGQAAAADAGGLAKFLGQQQGLHLVFLNGCSTQQQTQGLLDATISVVISTSRAIEDQVATDFSNQFYQGLAGGASIRTAYNEAEASVQTSKGGNTRGLYFGNKDDSQNRLETDRWPWDLYLREGSEIADQWNLPEAVNDPLFGLPSLPEQDLPESPYRHLNWFTHKDAELFFGRGHQIRELYDRLTAPRTAPIMLFYGQSGVGKSSILDAGLLPRLERDYEVRYLRRGSGGLLDTLQLAFLPEGADAPIETAWRVKEKQTGKPLIVFLDQVEELKTRPIADLPDEWDQFLRAVKAIFNDPNCRPQGKLVFGFRKEWLAEMETELSRHELPRTKVFLEPLDRRGIVEVVQGPARSARLREHYGLTVEGGLAENIADDLLADRDSAIAPTLQILLTKMWAKATETNYEQPQFTQELYKQLKRDGILLRDFLNQQIATFRQEYPEAVDSGLLLDIVALHTTPLGTADQRTVEQLRAQYAHLGDALPDVLRRCQDLHLLTVAASAQKESTKTTRLAHDTLAPLVRERFESSDKPGQRARRILDNRSVDWAEDREGTPLDEADLKVVEQGATGTRALSATEQRLVEASRELRARLKRLRMILKIAGAAAVTVIAVTAGVALWQWKQAEIANVRAFDARKKADTNRGLARELMSDLVPEVTAAAPFPDTVKVQFAEQTRGYYHEFVNKHSQDPKDEAQTRRVMADAMYVIGRIYGETLAVDGEQKPNFSKAIQAFEKACDWQCKELNVKPDNIASLRVRDDNEGLVNDLGYTLNALGNALRRQGNPQAAKDRLSEAAAIRKRLADFRPDQIEYRLLHASSVMNIGLAERKLGDVKRARQLYQEADKIRRDLWDAAETEADKRSIERHIALGNLNLAVMLQSEDRKTAEQVVTEAIELYEKLSKDDYQIQAELANCYQMRGRLKLERETGEVFDPVERRLGKKTLEEFTVEEVSVAIDDYENAATICKRLFGKRPWIAEYQNQLTDLSLVLIDLYQPRLKVKRLKPTLEKVREFWQYINGVDRFAMERDPESVDALNNFGGSSLEIANLCVETKDWVSARQRLEAGVRLWRELVEKDRANQQYRNAANGYLAQLLHLKAKALIGCEMYGSAEEAKQDALVRWDRLIDASPEGSEDRAWFEGQREMTKTLNTQSPAVESGSSQ